MKAYLYFIKVRVLVSMAYRFEAISSICVQFILLMINAFFWRAVFANRDTVQNVDLYQMLIFSVMATLLSCFFVGTVEHKLRQRIRDGSVALDYIKPVSLFKMFFAEDIGEIAVNVIQRAIPIIIFSSFLIVVPLPASAVHLFLFLLSACISLLILWFIAAIFGLLNFWLIDLGPIGSVKDHVIAFLSGSIVPIWFFPGAVQRVLAFMPFIYTYQTPIGIYIGRTAPQTAIMEIGIQAVWCVFFYGLFTLIKSRALKNIMVQGG